MESTLNYEQIVKELKRFGYDATVITVNKNGIKRTGVMIGNSDRRLTYYPDPEDTVKEAVKKIFATYEKERAEADRLNIKKLTSWEYIKDHMSLCIQRKTDEPLLKHDFLDLEMYIRVDIPDYGEYSLLSALVNDQFGADADEIFSCALTKLMDEIEIIPMEKLVGNFFPTQIVPEQLIVTTKSKLHGASAICSDALLRAIAKRYQSNLVILPSSIHECIITVDDDPDMEPYHEMVEEVNRMHIDPVDQLSDHAYFYDRETGKITW